MERTPEGTPVGVDDPYAVAGRCDHLTDDGRCRYALAYAGNDPEFAAGRRADEYECVVADDDVAWKDCPHYRSTTTGKECVRCGLEEVRLAHEGARPLLEEHHLSYGSSSDAGDGEPSHEITVSLCRWCHAKIHNSFARIDDDASPDPEAFAAREERRSREQAELGFSTAAERWAEGKDDGGEGKAGWDDDREDGGD
ncbi:MAG: hypothetical protein ABEJ74_04625 [Haloferacaceae archaeon]